MLGLYQPKLEAVEAIMAERGIVSPTIESIMRHWETNHTESDYEREERVANTAGKLAARVAAQTKVKKRLSIKD